MGSINGTVRRTVDILRASGVPVGMVKLRVFRPFPARQLAAELAAAEVPVVSVLEKVNDLGSGGPLFQEVAAALAARVGIGGGRIPILLNHLAGLGGRDVTLAGINAVFSQLLKVESRGSVLPGEQFSTVDAGGTGEKALSLSPGRPARALVRFPRTFVFAARGGQGAKTACYLFAQIGVEMGQYAQGFPTYGPERTGAPIKGYARLGPDPIPEREQISSPDVLAVFDETLLSGLAPDIAGMPAEGVLLVNTRRGPEEIRALLGISGRRIYTLDADGIAQEEFQARRPNTAMMAAMMKITGAADLDLFRKAFTKKMHKLAPRVLEGNLRAIDRAVLEVRGEEAAKEPNLSSRS
jgi:pyruvate ferredoxin oxidoreductase gamma subunit